LVINPSLTFSPVADEADASAAGVAACDAGAALGADEAVPLEQATTTNINNESHRNRRDPFIDPTSDHATRPTPDRSLHAVGPRPVALVNDSTFTSHDQRDDPLLVVRGGDLLADLPAAAQDHGPIGDLDDMVERVRDDEDGVALGPKAGDQVEDATRLPHAKRGRGFVEDHELGGECRGARDGDSLSLSA
jgi:hypothetical protein